MFFVLFVFFLAGPDALLEACNGAMSICRVASAP